MSKLENPIRLIELMPKKTLIEVGLRKGDVFCDIGAGTGVFTIEAAAITHAATYAIDTSEDMLNAVTVKARALGIENINNIKSDGFDYPIDDNSCDFVFMSSVLHEIDNKKALMNEIQRILRDDGKLIIIEFHKKATPLGPQEQHRISINETKEVVENCGFSEISIRNLGENFYLCVFIKPETKQI